MTALVFLKTDEDFNQFRQSKLATSQNFRLRVRFNTNQNAPRFGFIVPKKVLPQVVDRNKIKRRLKSILQKHFARIKPADYLWLPAKSSVKTPFLELEQEVLKALQSLRVWKA